MSIDNSRNVYIPLRLRCGIQIRCRTAVLRDCPQVLSDLEKDLAQCLRILPRSVQPLVRRTRFWVNQSYCFGSHENPKIVNHTTAHHHEAWLLWAKDRPEKAHGIEIYNCWDYRRMRQHWNGCGLILHELCHLIHQQVLGLDCESVRAAYATAQQSGKYDSVLRRDWAGKPDGDTDLSYAMVDHKEFFAEMSVTYWSRGYRHLDRAAFDKLEECCPPIMEPDVQARIGQKHPNLVADPASSSTEHAAHRLSAWVSRAFHRGHELSHCNKFYPFTRGQLQYYDSATFAAMDRIWTVIATWEDPSESQCTGCWNVPWRHKYPKQSAFDCNQDEGTETIPDTVDL